MNNTFKNVGPRKGACKTYIWNPVSAVQKGWSIFKNGTFKSSTAFRSCMDCGKHKNYHMSGKRAP